MIFFIASVTAYLGIGWIHLSKQLRHGDILTQSPLVVRRKYRQYVLSWPLDYFANTIVLAIINKAQTKQAGTKGKKKASNDIPGVIQVIRAGYSPGQREAIITALLVIGTQSGETDLLVEEAKFIEHVRSSLGINSNDPLFNKLLSGRDGENFQKYLKALSDDKKSFFINAVDGLLHCSSEKDSLKRQLAMLILGDAGIDEARYKNSRRQTIDDLKSNP